MVDDTRTQFGGGQVLEESEFKKLTANSRDWLIYQLLSEKSKESVLADLVGEKETTIRRLGGLNLSKSPMITHSKPAEPKGETTVQEIVKGTVVLVTDKAVLIGNADRVAWFPKSVIENLDKIVLDKDKIVELKIKDWFKYKIVWKVPEQ